MKRAALALTLLLAGCATRGTIRELGRPDFEGTVPAELVLTLVEPQLPGQFHAYPRGSGKGDYHAETRMVTAPRRMGDEILLVLETAPTGDQRVTTFEVLVWPLHAKDVARFKENNRLPGGPPPIARKIAKQPVPGREIFRLELEVPVKELNGADQLGISTFVRYEDGWITIVDSATAVPPP